MYIYEYIYLDIYPTNEMPFSFYTAMSRSPRIQTRLGKDFRNNISLTSMRAYVHKLVYIYMYV